MFGLDRDSSSVVEYYKTEFEQFDHKIKFRPTIILINKMRFTNYRMKGSKQSFKRFYKNMKIKKNKKTGKWKFLFGTEEIEFITRICRRKGCGNFLPAINWASRRVDHNKTLYYSFNVSKSAECMCNTHNI